MKIFNLFGHSFFLIFVLFSCNSVDYLDAKPQKSLLVPSTLKDLEALLNNSNSIMNRAGYLSLSADGDFIIDESYLPYVDEPTRINYMWLDETTSWIGDWDYAYQQTFYANVVLQLLEDMHEKEDITLANELKGRALFYRAWALHLIAQQFAGVYSKETANTTLGIPCPISPDVNQTFKRLSLQETYNLIFSDLHISLELLPAIASFTTQPSKASSYALLSRLYLITGEYDKALRMADEALFINSSLLDYNEINTELDRPFPLPMINPNPEILYYTIGPTTFTSNVSTFVDSSLFKLYDAGDLRKKLFFNSSLNYKGSYTGGVTPFLGLATDEIYLIKAECHARLNEIENSLGAINQFASKRYSSKEFVEISETDPQELLKYILLERRRELIGRGITWMDLRRLNKETVHARSLKRIVDGKTFTLNPGDKRYIMKIPTDEIAASGIEQNL